MAKKYYYLYLDESGDFNEDLKEAWKNECLVGGLLAEDEPLPEEKLRADLIACAKSLFPGIRLSDGAFLKKISHSTELEEDKKAEVVCSVLELAEKYGKFVIFSNFRKARIIDATTTYANIMADGIVQLLGRLCVENPSSEVELHILAGFKKDITMEVTADPFSGYVDPKACTNRINERLALLRVRSSSILAHKGRYRFDYKDDKTYPPLILADYICNFFFTTKAQIYRTNYKDGVSYKDYLLEKYAQRNIFSLNGNSERERLEGYLNIQDFAAAFYEICTGLVADPSAADPVVSAFVQLPEAVRQNQLQSFDNYLNNLVAVERRTDDAAIAILDKASSLLDEITAKSRADIAIFGFSLLLYKLAVYNHRGDIAKMNELFEKGRELASEIGGKAEYINYLFMFYNRYAVFLNDNYQVEKGFDTLEKVLSAFEGIELALESLPVPPKNGMVSDQRGKILGTQVQCCKYLMACGKMTYEKAASVSDRAIQSLTREGDRMRQYQYRAQIEMEANHYEEARTYLLKGCGHEKLSDFFSEDKRFDLYHLSCFVNKFAGDSKHEEEIKAIVRSFAGMKKKLDGKAFPDFVILGNMAGALAQRREEKEQIKSWYVAALDGDENTEELFHVMKLAYHVEYICYLQANSQLEAAEEKERLERICEVLEKETAGLSQGLHERVCCLRTMLQKGMPEEEAREYSRCRLY